MNHLFCQSCGNKLEYANAKPNFCVKCGTALHSHASSMTVAPKIQQPASATSEDETNAESIPHIDRLEVEYDVSNGNNTFTLGSLAGQNTPPDYKGGNAPSSVDEFIDDKKE